MTDRISGFYVVLERDIREDDAQEIINAVRCLRHVLSVDAHVADFASRVAEERVRREFGEKLWDVLHPPKPGAP